MPNVMPNATPNATVCRIEVRNRPGLDDPRGRAVQKQAAGLGISLREVRTARIYLIEPEHGRALTESQVAIVRDRLLADPVTEVAAVGAFAVDPAGTTIEVHPLPGVMDPAAESVRGAIGELLGDAVHVSTGTRYDLLGASDGDARSLATRALANGIVQAVHVGPFHPSRLPRGKEGSFQLRHVPIRGLSREQLTTLSREAHLFLSLDEMLAIQAEYARVGREPTDIELETLAQTWSEHCVHKTLKSRIRYRHGGSEARRHEDSIQWSGRPGHTVEGDGSVTIDNLLKRTVAAATFELIDDGIDWTLSVFKDNAGVIAFDETTAVCIKVETHNHPSALEPYGGAATGAGGCIRDVIGTGLAAKPIANTDVFCVATPEGWGTSRALPPGTLDPKRILQQVVAGVRDYGNRMGIPTVNGAVAFDDRYVGNPLVFCGCVGVMPRNRIKGQVQAGDVIVALGGRTGRDGIHGATFSSAELEEGHVDEFSHAVQIGNAIEEKRVLDAILRARDEFGEPLFHGLTDCGAGGFSSAVGEMGSEVGAEVHLERAPLKYAGLSYTEIWISEAQERMVLAVPRGNLDRLRRICGEEGVELAELGTFGTPGKDIVLHYRGTEVGRLSCHFLHEGIPQPTREAVWSPAISPSRTPVSTPAHGKSTSQLLLSLLSSPTIASKHWIVRQYDHEVQGNTVVKPLQGKEGRGPGDAAVLEPVPGSGRGLAIGCGLQTGLGDPAIEHAGADAYLMVLAAVDECVRNLVCVGADPTRVAILDNFCWPSCQKPENLGRLVRAAEGCYDAAKAYRTPFVSGKDSLNNQLKFKDAATGVERVIEIPPTLLVTGMGIVPEIGRAMTMDAKAAGNVLLLVGATAAEMGGSSLDQLLHPIRGADGLPMASRAALGPVPRTDLKAGPAIARAVHGVIAAGLVRAAHDVSDGGLLVAVSEMLIASPELGISLDLSAVHGDAMVAAFGESPSRYVLEVAAADVAAVERGLGGVPMTKLGVLDASGTLKWNKGGVSLSTAELAKAWLSPLDW